MNSIMVPTFFRSLAGGLGKQAADGMRIINFANFDGAVAPLLARAVADLSGHLPLALALSAACHVVTAAFGLYCRR